MLVNNAVGGQALFQPCFGNDSFANYVDDNFSGVVQSEFLHVRAVIFDSAGMP